MAPACPSTRDFTSLISGLLRRGRLWHRASKTGQRATRARGGFRCVFGAPTGCRLDGQESRLPGLGGGVCHGACLFSPCDAFLDFGSRSGPETRSCRRPLLGSSNEPLSGSSESHSRSANHHTLRGAICKLRGSLAPGRVGVSSVLQVLHSIYKGTAGPGPLFRFSFRGRAVFF